MTLADQISFVAPRPMWMFHIFHNSLLKCMIIKEKKNALNMACILTFSTTLTWSFSYSRRFHRDDHKCTQSSCKVPETFDHF